MIWDDQGTLHRMMLNTHFLFIAVILSPTSNYFFRVLVVFVLTGLLVLWLTSYPLYWGETVLGVESIWYKISVKLLGFWQASGIPIY